MKTSQKPPKVISGRDGRSVQYKITGNTHNTQKKKNKYYILYIMTSVDFMDDGRTPEPRSGEMEIIITSNRYNSEIDELMIEALKEVNFNGDIIWNGEILY